MKKLLSLMLVVAFVGVLVLAQEKNAPAEKSDKPKTESVQKKGCCPADMSAKMDQCRSRDCCQMKEGSKNCTMMTEGAANKGCCMDPKQTNNAKQQKAPPKKG
jgi:hypothetical protein